MLDSLAWLSLEVLYLDRARDFYETTLDLAGDEMDGEIRLPVGDTELRLVEPGPVPRGGVHVHFAMATPPDRYGEWYDRLEESFDLEEHEFGHSRSLYLFDPDGHCVEIGSVGPDGDDRALTGVFEVVLEVEDLERSTAFYRDLGFEPVDRGTERRRVRLSGPMDLELWEPQRGLADARGGVHVDLGFESDDPVAVAEQAGTMNVATVEVEEGISMQDPDGHYLTVRRS